MEAIGLASWVSLSFLFPCQDPAYPQLHQDRVLGCGPEGRVDRVWDLTQGVGAELTPQGPLFWARGGLFSPGRSGRLWDLSGGSQRLPGLSDPEWSKASASPQGRICMSQPDHLWCLEPSGDIHRYPARPMPWYPPATGEDALAWVEESAPGQRELQLRSLSDHSVRTIAESSARPRHPVIAEGRLAWIEDDQVCLLELEGGEARCWESQPRSAVRLSLSEGVVCWEETGAEDLDIHCSDGVRVGGAGDQRSPSRQGSELVFTSGGRVWWAQTVSP